MEYYFNNDHTKVAVLVSPDYGAGWSTWNHRNMACDKRVVEFWIKNPEIHDDDISFADEAMEKLGYSDTYFGGYNNIKLVWVPVGVKFRIKEYDGFETLETFKEADYFIAGEDVNGTD